MTNEQVLQYVEHIEESEKRESASLNRSLLFRMAKHMTKKGKADLLAELKQHVEYFRPSDAPNHRTWYPYYLQLTAHAIRLFEET